MKLRGVIIAAALGALAGSAMPAVAGEMNMENAASIMRGGQLYDKWWKVNGADEPSGTHSAYPADAAKDGSATWRCKECHGWDYIGPNGRYASGSHYTGIKGVADLAGGDTAAIAAAIRGEPHGFTDAHLSDGDVADLALFIAQGQVDIASYISDGMASGDAATGEAVYATVCAGCHGNDGMKIKDMPPLGEIAGNPQETMHKILFGQPNEAMPGLLVFGSDLAADITAYLHTLPK